MMRAVGPSRERRNMFTRLASPALVPLVLCLARSPAMAQEDGRFTDDELAGLAASCAAYTEARGSSVGVAQARSELASALEELGEKTGGEHPLEHASDLGRALWLSRDYDEAKPRAGAVVSDVFQLGFDGAGTRFSYRLPEDYDPGRGAYPLIVAIPDEGQGPAEHIRSSWTLRDILDRAILVCPAMPDDQQEWARVTVNGRPGGLSHVLTVLRIAGERFAVDFDRVYVAGRGKGVPAAVAAGNYSPQRFAGVLGRAGDAGDLGPDNFGNLPTYFAGAGAKAAAFQTAAREAGFDNCQLQPAGKERDVWNWILDHPRRSHPPSVTVVPGDPFPTRAYWLCVAPTSPDARATATIERESNTVRITGEGVAQATLYLNDALVDLDRALRVICNGVESTSLLRRDLSATLDMLWDGTSDVACVYVAEATYDMTGEAPELEVAASPGSDAEYARRLAEAEGEAARLWDLYGWCRSSGREARGPGVLRRLLRLDADHEDARTALGHIRSGDRWFTSREALERVERSQVEETARAKGHVRHKSLWMHPDERSLASKGWSKGPESGQWLSASDRRRLADGWARQDLEWIPPEEASRVDDGLWRVDGQWLDLRRANQRRARIDSMWRIPGTEVLLYSTADRDVSLRAMHEMGRAIEDLRRVFGAEPVLPLRVALLRDEEQYDRFAFGDPDGRRRATHAGRLHVIHSAFFAESWFPWVEGRLEFRGMGVCYWDALVPNGNLYGVHSARLAVGLSYVEALDPSPKAVRKALKDGPRGDYYDAYLAEKKLPAWLRYGGAVYAERYFRDTSAEPDGDPWWARAWSIENLRSRGGLRDLEELLDFRLDPDDREDGLKLLIEAGLVVAFVVDGECAPVAEEHAKLEHALVSGRLHANHVRALTEAIVAHEMELKAFAGL